MSTKPLVEIKNLSKHYRVEGAQLRAVSGFNLTIERGETVGLVGESGCGKSTVGRTILRLCMPTAGEIFFNGVDLSLLRRQELKKMRQKMQMVFQDPYASLNPRMNVQDILSEPLEIHQLVARRARVHRCRQLLQLVGLNPNHLSRFPHEFSGGQRQRIGIARALAVEPEFIVCDEPISALDVSIQAQVVNLLKDLQKKMNLTYLFIAHDLAMVRYISDKVAVMYLGQLVEFGTAAQIYSNPLHPYTRALLASIPIPDPEIEKKRAHFVLKGEVPSPIDPPKGCPFHPRCPQATKLCAIKRPSWQEVSGGHFTACHLHPNSPISLGKKKPQPKVKLILT